MQHLTLIFRGNITVDTNSNTERSISSRFERAEVRPARYGGLGDGVVSNGRLSVHSIYVDMHGGDVQESSTDVNAALVGFLDRNKDILEVVTETELQSKLPPGCVASVQFSFWRGSVAIAATITLLLVGKHYAQREALNFLQVTIGPTISRCLRQILAQVALEGPRRHAPIGVTLALDPSSIAAIESFRRKSTKKLNRFDRQTAALTKHVYFKGIAILLLGVFAMLVALIVGAPYWAGWLDAARAAGGRLMTP